jgi:hypothetical protein
VKAADTGLPLINTDVYADEPTLDYFQWADTDTLGNCTIRGLPSGSYIIYFEEFRLRSYSACVITEKYYAGEYYNDKPDRASADPVPLTAPSTVSGINALLGVGTPPVILHDLYLPVILR